MIPILFVLSAYALAAWILHSTVKHCGDAEFSIWSTLGILAIARLSSRGTLMLAAGVDPFTKIGIGFGVYATVLSVALALWGRVPWGRAIAWGVGIAIMMFVASIAAVTFLAPSTHPGGSVP